MPSLFGYVGSFISNNRAATVLGFTAMVHQFSKNYWVPDWVTGNQTVMLDETNDAWFKPCYMILDALVQSATFAGIGYLSDRLSKARPSTMIEEVRSLVERHKMAIIFGAGRLSQAAWQDYWVYKKDTKMTVDSANVGFKTMYLIIDFVATAVQWGGVGNVADQVLEKLLRSSIIEDSDSHYNSINLTSMRD